MNIIDELNTKVAQNRASTRAVARACGATVAEMDEDMSQPDGNIYLGLWPHGRALGTP